MSKHSNRPRKILPREPIDRLVEPVVRFMHVAAAGGVVLLLCTVVALVMANSPWSESYLAFWQTTVEFQVGSFHFEHSLYHLINDGLMVIFFFVIGLEVKREMVSGELRDFRRAALPIAAAIGGMVVPAGIYLAMQAGQPGARGWGIPMATDIAFVVGCMAILGRRVPHGLRVMLLSLAIADDIGAIIVIAVGYTSGVNVMWMLYAGLSLLAIVAMQRVGIRSFAAYVVVGIFMWYAFLESGIHATLAGVILGLLTPARIYLGGGAARELLDDIQEFLTGDWEADTHRAETIRRLQKATRETVSPLNYLENLLHPWVGFVIMPVFALANAGVVFDFGDLASPVAIAVMLGLVIGKPVGIFILSFIAVKSGLGSLPTGVGWKAIFGGGCLAGIGFTMALFIATLAFDTESAHGGHGHEEDTVALEHTHLTEDEQQAHDADVIEKKLMQKMLNQAKVGVLVGSAISAIVGSILLLLVLPKPPELASS